METLAELHHEKDRRFVLIEINNLHELTERLASLSRHYALFTAVDSSQEESSNLLVDAEKLVSSGLAYLCAWGRGCEQWHDCVDKVEQAMAARHATEDVLMTTWHSNETLDEALFFFRFGTLPTESYAKDCTDYVIAAAPAYADAIRAYFLAPLK